MSDALRANDTVFQHLTNTIHYQSLESLRNPAIARPVQSLALQVRCSIHQASLTRRVMVLGFDGFWSSFARLGHLFESHSFRTRFHAAMAKVVRDSFQFVECQDLPDQASHWRAQKIRRLRLFADHNHAGLGKATLSKRMRILLIHRQKHNGDPESDVIVHWCSGCCPGGEQECLAGMIESFARLFDQTCVPLLSRWKHAAPACSFVRDGSFLASHFAQNVAKPPKHEGQPAWKSSLPLSFSLKLHMKL